MAYIIWGPWQEEHIEFGSHPVTPEEFDHAWHDPERKEIEEGNHEKHGPYMKSVGLVDDLRELIMVWRYQYSDKESQAVFPITAYFPD